jgi:hypothetical protein
MMKVKSVVTDLYWCNGGKNSSVYQKSGTSNPVIVLDEIDKIGQGFMVIKLSTFRSS